MEQKLRIKNLRSALSHLIHLARIYKSMDQKRRQLTALVGECLVFLELTKLGLHPSWKGKEGGGRYDIKVNGKKIEVKAGIFNKKHRHWGFGNIHSERFDFLVCVALDGKLNLQRYLIFTKDEANFPLEPSARFKKRAPVFHFFKKKDEKFQNSVKMIKLNRAIRRSIKKYENWDKIII